MGPEKRSKKRVPLAAPAVLDLAEFASLEDVKEIEINVPLSILRSGYKGSPSLCISLTLTELRTTQELPEEVQRPTMFAPLSPCFGDSPPLKRNEGSVAKSLRKVKSLTDYVSSRRSKAASRGEFSSDSKFSTGSEDSEHNDPFDTDSFGDDSDDDEESEESKDITTDVQNWCSYGTLVHANLAGGALDLRIMNCQDDDDLVYYRNKKLDLSSSPAQDFGSALSDQQVLRQGPKFGILAWRNGKLSFKSRTRRVKGEPLLKKDYGEEGGDDIDFDRRQLSSSESMTFEELIGSGSLISEFGDDNFTVGSWEEKEILSRDGRMKLQTRIFYASIDQRSERAAGESACTALVAVIADWIHTNLGEMPTKSEFDSLIREGSLQWRNLCENDTYRDRFPDKHFDLDTVLEAKIRPLSVVPERSFIGFFHPEGLEEGFDFLRGAMSFDNIWDEICRVALDRETSTSEPLVYIVSWNDHFFLLRVDSDAYYIIDTLGERLFEGCNQAYVLKFDRDTTIIKVPATPQTPRAEEKSESAAAASSDQGLAVANPEAAAAAALEDGKEEEETVVCKGKECCKEYIKSFLAAIPIRELQVDMKKGLMASTPLHHRLQIEFHYTSQFSLPSPAEFSAPAPGTEEADVLEVMAVDVAAPPMVAVAVA